jgi:hypothetical protein
VVLEGRGREVLPSKATRYPLTENRGREKISCASRGRGREPCDVPFPTHMACWPIMVINRFHDHDCWQLRGAQNGIQ